MNTPKFFFVIGMAFALAACGGGSGNTTSTDDQNNNMDPTDPSDAGNGTFPNGIWEATGTRDVFFDNPPTFGEAYAGGIMITNTSLDIYEATIDDGLANGVASCYRPTTDLTWRSWPTSVSEFNNIGLVFEGNFESGMQRRTLDNGADADLIYYTYVGPVTSEAEAAFHERYEPACNN